MRQGQKTSETLLTCKISDSFDSGGASSLAVESHPSKKKATNNHLLVAFFLLLSSKFRSGSSLPVLRTTKCDAFSEARRTKNRLLRYGRDIRCQKRLPVVRDVFSEAFGVKNRLLRYGRDIRYRKRFFVKFRAVKLSKFGRF